MAAASRTEAKGSRRAVAVSSDLTGGACTAMPLTMCCLKAAGDGLIFGYGRTDEIQLRDGVRRLTRILRGMPKHLDIDT